MGANSAAWQPNWRPFCFRIYYVLPLVLLHIAHIIGLQALVARQDKDYESIELVQKNVTETSHLKSIFIFSESNLGAFIFWQYVPVVIAIVIAILWERVDVTVRRLEPFHQLSRPEGGTAKNALCLNYTTMFSFSVPYQAARRRHWAVTISSTLYLAVFSAIPAFTSGMFSINWATFSYSAGKVEGAKLATVSVNPGFIVAGQVFHGLAAGLAILLYIILWQRQSGLYKDPRGIGGIASLICESAIVHNFRQIPSFVHSKNLESALDGTRFYLQHLPVPNHTDNTTGEIYQLTADVHTSMSPPPRHFDHDRIDANGIWLTRRMVWLAECFFTISHGIIVAVVYQAAKAMASSHTADDLKPAISKFTYAICVSIAGSMWQSIQRDAQTLEPWRQLALGRRPRHLYDALVKSDMISLGLITGTVYSIFRLAVVTCWAGFASLTMRAAVIFLPPIVDLGYAAGYIGERTNTTSSVPVEPERPAPAVLRGATGSVLAGVAIAVHLVAFLNVCFFVYSGRCKPFMPRQPSTIASQVLYLCHSQRLLGEFVGTSTLSSSQTAKRLGRVRRKYRFGWFWRGGKQWFVGVEEEPPQDDGFMRFNFKQGLVWVGQPL